MKKKGKKLISIALTVAMIAGLTACGKGNGGNGNGGGSAADASLAKQYALLLTGGTDFHGQNKPHISLFTGQGNMEVPEAILPEFMEAIGFTR